MLHFIYRLFKEQQNDPLHCVKKRVAIAIYFLPEPEQHKQVSDPPRRN